MKKLYWLLEFEEIHLIMSLPKMMKWIKDDVGDLERDGRYNPYKISPVWLTKKEYNALNEADI